LEAPLKFINLLLRSASRSAIPLAGQSGALIEHIDTRMQQIERTLNGMGTLLARLTPQQATLVWRSAWPAGRIWRLAGLARLEEK